MNLQRKFSSIELNIFSIPYTNYMCNCCVTHFFKLEFSKLFLKFHNYYMNRDKS